MADASLPSDREAAELEVGLPEHEPSVLGDAVEQEGKAPSTENVSSVLEDKGSFHGAESDVDAGPVLPAAAIFEFVPELSVECLPDDAARDAARVLLSRVLVEHKISIESQVNSRFEEALSAIPVVLRGDIEKQLRSIFYKNTTLQSLTKCWMVARLASAFNSLHW